MYYNSIILIKYNTNKTVTENDLNLDIFKNNPE